jgi:hypothetical protein
MNGAPRIAFRFRSTAPMPRVERTLLLPATSNPAIADAGACGFRRSRPGIPIDVGHLFRSKSAGRSD